MLLVMFFCVSRVVFTDTSFLLCLQCLCQEVINLGAQGLEPYKAEPVVVNMTMMRLLFDSSEKC